MRTEKYLPPIILESVVTTTPVVLSGTNYLRMDRAVAGQLDVWASTTNAGTPTDTYQLSQVSSITDAGTSGNDTLTADLSGGNPLAAISPGISFNTMGTAGGTDSVVIIGDNDGDSYTASNGQILISGGIGASAFTAVPINFADVAAESILAGIGRDVLLVTSTNPVTFTAPVGGAHPIADLSSLSIGSGSKVLFNSPNANRALLELGSATNWAGQLDLRANDMLVQGGASALTTINGLVANGYNKGTWAGEGIASSSASANTSHLTALGAILNGQAGTPLFNSSNEFDGVVPATTDVLVKYTYYGDANLDGKIDGSDYSRIDNGYLSRLTGWFNGDFNYDGTVDGSDYTLIDNAFNTQGASMAASIESSQANVRTVASNIARTRKVASDVVTEMPGVRSSNPGERSKGLSFVPNVFSNATPIAFANAFYNSIELSMQKKDILDRL